MALKKPKPVYSLTRYDDVGPTAVYSCLKTLCEQWDLIDHYAVIWKTLRRNEAYQDSRITVKKHTLIRAEYLQGGTKPTIPVL